MSDKAQFRIKTLLGVTVAFSMPFALIAAGYPFRSVGLLLLVPVVAGSVAYLVGERLKIQKAMLAILVLMLAWMLLTIVTAGAFNLATN